MVEPRLPIRLTVDAAPALVELQRPEWHASAACARLDLPPAERTAMFHPERGDPIAPAKAICRTCPVRDECREWAIDHPEVQGIWGATSDKERRRLRRNRKGTAA